MADDYDPVPDLAELVVAALGYNTTDPAHYAGRVTMRLRIGEDDSVQAVATALRKALGIAPQCRCGITPGAPSEVLPLACPVHGTPCEYCGGVESCTEDCGEGPAPADVPVTGTMTDAMGHEIRFGAGFGAVFIGVDRSPAILSTQAMREDFTRHFFAADTEMQRHGPQGRRAELWVRD